MKKKIVLVVLCGVLAWAIWGRKVEREPLILSDSCARQALVWCGYKLCRTGDRVSQSCAQPCISDYVPRCMNGRSGTTLISGDAHDAALEGIRAVHDVWRP